MRNLEIEMAKMDNFRKKILVKDLNECVSCKLCHGYLIDATTLVDCLHTFCRGCILRHFDNSKTQVQCPVCPVLYKKKSQSFRSDAQMQALLYKAVPSLYFKEMQRREDFYRSTGVRAGSSCSDDSVIDRERDMMNEMEELVSQNVGDKAQYFNQDDLISLSLEYYQAHLDHTNADSKNSAKSANTENIYQVNNTGNGLTNPNSNISVENSCDSKCDNKQTNAENNGKVCGDVSSDKVLKECDKRFLRCPAGINMKHLQKFIRMKYGLTGDHRVDIIYKGEVLHSDFSLMDVAYTFQWEKIKPMRLFYRIFTPLKIRPIKIVNTATPTGEKQLQIVPISTNNHIATNTLTDSPPVDDAIKLPKLEEKLAETKQIAQVVFDREETESEQQDKEILLANLQLQSKSKALQNAEAKKVQAPEKIVRECVFEYEEPDEEEIKRFAEKRDREWALQKKLEEETKADNDDFFLNRDNYPTKKRKRSKHSKTDSNGHKEKRRKTHADKIHAEITNNDKSDLKLKVKITTNGYKHKHHKIENASELTNKEKLLQMRQVRHKHMSGSSGDERSQPAIPTIKLPKSHSPEETKEAKAGEPEAKRKKENPKPSEQAANNRVAENTNKPQLESQPKPKVEPMIIKSVSTVDSTALPSASKTSVQPGELAAKAAKKSSCLKSTQFDSTDRQSQKTFLKSTISNPDKYTKDQKIGQNKVENSKAPGSLSNKVLPIGSITTNNKTLDRKIASLQQRCTIEPKIPTKNVHFTCKNEAKISNKSENIKMVSAQYPPGFTVSKIETGIKRKPESTEQDKRPSLEITLIPPSTPSPSKVAEPKTMNKRPPPGTIPLERIKNAVNSKLKSGISIIPKLPDRTDNIGVLDLSKSGKSPGTTPRSSPKTEPINGLNSMVNRQIGNMIQKPMSSPNRATPENKNVQLSNLQMLSKVATEHPTLNKLAPNHANKARPQLPNLQTIGKMSSPNGARPPGFQRMIPKLNDIQKFRPASPQIRNIRPNQNQNIRNIPNPSLILNRHQHLNQTKVVSSANVVSTSSIPERKVTSPPKSSPVPVTSSTSSSTTKELSSAKPPTTALEQKVTETKEISV